MSSKEKYWVDKDNNKWSTEIYSEAQARFLSSTLVNCHECINCHELISCYNCENCIMCIKCISCTECYKCISCSDCKGLRNKTDQTDQTNKIKISTPLQEAKKEFKEMKNWFNSLIKSINQ